MLDTNVLVSGILSPAGAGGALIELVRSGQVEMVSSPTLLEELEEVLGRFMPHPAAGEIRAAIEEIAQLVRPDVVPAVTIDPDDDHVLAAAVGGRAHYIISRDRHLLSLERHEGIEILDPAAGLQAVRAGLEGTSS